MRNEHKIFERPDSQHLLIDEPDSQSERLVSIIVPSSSKVPKHPRQLAQVEDDTHLQLSVVSIKDKINKLSNNLLTYNRQVREVLDNIPQSVVSETMNDEEYAGSRVMTLGKISQLSIMRDDEESEVSRYTGSKLQSKMRMHE